MSSWRCLGKNERASGAWLDRSRKTVSSQTSSSKRVVNGVATLSA